MWSSGPSDVNSGAVTPSPRRPSARRARYSWSEPYEPYSFSTCTMITGPPRSCCRSTTWGSSAANQRSTAARNSPSLVRAREPSGPVSQCGSPPFSHSAQM